jgi:hypothetical protein
MSARRYYRTLFQVEVLSEDTSFTDTDLDAMHEAITTGDCSGVVRVEFVEEVDGPAMARLLLSQGSDPEFFQLDENGHELSA